MTVRPAFWAFSLLTRPRPLSLSLPFHSNQGTIRSAHSGKNAEKLASRADSALAALGPSIPLTVVYCTATTKDACPARKPGRGMWDFYVSVARPPAAPPVEMEGSFYCGDAAGRGVGENSAAPTEPDFADSDAGLARAVGLDFKVPEDVFGPAEGLGDYSARREAGHGDGGGAGEGVGSPGKAAARGGKGPNAALVNLFRQIAASSDGFRAIAVNKAAKVLETLDGAITDFAAFKKTKVPGIGKSSLAWIEEFLSTGDIAAAHAPKPTPAPAQDGVGALAFA